MENYILCTTGTVKWLEDLHVPNTEPFIYVPVFLETLVEDWILPPDNPTVGTGILQKFREHGYSDEESLNLARTGMAYMQNDLSGIKLDRSHGMYGCSVIKDINPQSPMYLVRVFRMADQGVSMSPYEVRREHASRALNKALTNYMDVHLLEDPEEAFRDFCTKKKGVWW